MSASRGGVVEPWSPRASGVTAAGLAAGAFGWAYAPGFGNLIRQWNADPNFSYGFLVVPIALVILWTRRGLVDRAKVRPSWWGLAFLLLVVAARYPLYERNEQYLEAATIPLVAACAVLALGGWHLARVGLPALGFLFFMLPLPPSLNQTLAGPLQSVATAGSVAVLQLLGMPVISEGNVIVIGDNPLEVARACNGLSMLLSFVTLITAMVILVDRSPLEKGVLLLSVVPIALVSNVVRIAATAVCYHRFGPEVGEGAAHSLSGWLMMPLALAMVWAELKVMSWLVVEVEDVDAASLIRRGRAGP